jgi:type III pantothenate kinase
LLQDKPLDELFDNLWADVPVPQKVVVACVANPRILQAMDRWLSRHWSLQAHVVKAQRELLGVKNHYREPATLGADRWVALIAAHRMSKRPLSVVDCGTAVTIDAVSAQGDFLGCVPVWSAQRRRFVRLAVTIPPASVFPRRMPLLEAARLVSRERSNA